MVFQIFTGTSKLITGSGDIQLNKDLWKKCPYEVVFCQPADLHRLQEKNEKKKKKKRSLMGSASLGQGVRNVTDKCSQVPLDKAVSQVGRIQSWCPEKLITTPQMLSGSGGFKLLSDAFKYFQYVF